MKKVDILNIWKNKIGEIGLEGNKVVSLGKLEEIPDYFSTEGLSQEDEEIVVKYLRSVVVCF